VPAPNVALDGAVIEVALGVAHGHGTAVLVLASRLVNHASASPATRVDQRPELGMACVRLGFEAARAYPPAAAAAELPALNRS
jgi:hypothetical protein